MANDNSIENASTQQTSQATDFRRRRLIRGALGAAPVILTLRSGALAAASCTGAKALAVTDTSGKFTNTTSGIVTGDRCVTPYNAAGCPSNKILSGTNAGSVSSSSSKWQCKTSSGTPIKSAQVAILSAAAVTSLV